MKKIALVLAVLLVVGGAAFAEVMVGGEATVAGSVTTTIGMDLDSRVWGADAGSSTTLTIPLANGSDGVSGDDAMYGEISLSDVAVNLSGIDLDADDNSSGTLAAKVVAGDIYVGLNSVGFNNNYAAGGADYDVNLDDDWYDVVKGNLAFGFNNGMIGIEVGVGAKSGLIRAAAITDNEDFVGAWDGETAAADATATSQGATGLVLSVDAKYVSDMITFPVYMTIDPVYATDTVLFAASINPTVVVGPVTITVPADFVMIGTDKGFDVAPALTYAIMEGLALTADGYIYNHVDTMYAADLGFKIATDGQVAGLTASVDVDLTNVTVDLGWGFDVAVGYAIADGLTVNVAPGFDSTDDLDLAGSLVLGSAFTGIDNTSFTLDYSSACFDVVEGYGAGASAAGILSLATSISF